MVILEGKALADQYKEKLLAFQRSMFKLEMSRGCDCEVCVDSDVSGKKIVSGEVTVKDVPQMCEGGRWYQPIRSPIADLEEEIKELKEENADLKMRIAKCEALLFTKCAEGHRFPKANPWCPECEKRLREVRESEEQHVGIKKQFIDGRWVW